MEIIIKHCLNTALALQKFIVRMLYKDRY